MSRVGTPALQRPASASRDKRAGAAPGSSTASINESAIAKMDDGSNAGGGNDASALKHADCEELKAQIRAMTRQRVQQIKQQERSRLERSRAIAHEAATAPLRFAEQTAKTFADLERPLIQEMQRWNAAYAVAGMYNDQVGDASVAAAPGASAAGGGGEVSPLRGQWLINRALKQNKQRAPDNAARNADGTLRTVDGIPVESVNLSAFKPAFRSGAWKPGSTTCDGAFPKFVGTGRFAGGGGKQSASRRPVHVLSSTSGQQTIGNAEHAAMFESRRFPTAAAADELEENYEDDDFDDGGYRPASSRRRSSPVRRALGNYNRPLTAISMTNSAVRQRHLSPQQRKDRGAAALDRSRHHVSHRTNDAAALALRRREQRIAAAEARAASLSPNGVFVISPHSVGTSSPLESLYHPHRLQQQEQAMMMAAKRVASPGDANIHGEVQNQPPMPMASTALDATPSRSAVGELQPESLVLQDESQAVAAGLSAARAATAPTTTTTTTTMPAQRPLSKPPSPASASSVTLPQPQSRPVSTVTASSTPEPNAAVPVPQQPQPRAVRFDERQAKPAARAQQQQKPPAATSSAAARRSDLFYGD